MVAAKYPLFSRLMDMRSYVFMTWVNQTAELEELIDEKRQICDVKPFRPVLKLVNKEGNQKEQILNSQISVLFGKGESTDPICSSECNYRFCALLFHPYLSL